MIVNSHAATSFDYQAERIDFIEESELAGFLPGVFGVKENASFDQSSMNVGDLIEKNKKKEYHAADVAQRVGWVLSFLGVHVGFYLRTPLIFVALVNGVDFGRIREVTFG